MGFFDKIQETIQTAADQTKVKAQETQLKRERKNKLEALGEQVYNLYLSGELSNPGLEQLCQEIEELDGRIAAAGEQFKAAGPKPPSAPEPFSGEPPKAPPPPPPA